MNLIEAINHCKQKCQKSKKKSKQQPVEVDEKLHQFLHLLTQQETRGRRDNRNARRMTIPSEDATFLL